MRRRLGAVGGQDPLLVAVGGERPFPWLLCPSHPSAGRGARAVVSVGSALMVLWAAPPTQEGLASSQLFFFLPVVGGGHPLSLHGGRCSRRLSFPHRSQIPGKHLGIASVESGFIIHCI